MNTIALCFEYNTGDPSLINYVLEQVTNLKQLELDLSAVAHNGWALRFVRVQTLYGGGHSIFCKESDAGDLYGGREICLTVVTRRISVEVYKGA